MSMYIHKPIIAQERWRDTAEQRAKYGEVKPDYLWTPFAPLEYVIHYGGGGPYQVRTLARAIMVVRGWWTFHVKTRGWRDIAYNAFAWRKLIILRGLNQNGAHRNSNLWGKVTFTVVFPLGPGEQPPLSWLRAFARQWIAEPMPVTDHGSLPEQYTQCAGKEMKALIADEFWLSVYSFKRTVTASVWPLRRAAVRALAYRLHRLGYPIRKGAKWINGHFEKVIEQFQADRGLPVTGKMGVEDLRELGRTL